MEIIFQLILILEMTCVNLYTSYKCCKKKKTEFVTWAYLSAFTIILFSVTLPFAMNHPNYGNGNGLFMCVGFLYLIPLKYLYDHPIKYLIIIMCSTWIYTALVFSISVQAAYLFGGEWFMLSTLILQTTIYAATFPRFFRFVSEKFIYMIQNIGDRTINHLLILSLSMFFSCLLLNYYFVIGAPQVLKLIIILLLATNAAFCYNLFYSLIFANRKMETLNELTKTDTLTKLRNRDGLYEDALKRIKNNIPFHIIFIDLDDFKIINDCFGHTVGDAYMIEFANTAKEEFRDNGCLYRMSGDEFIFLNEGQEIDSLCSRMEKLEFRNGQLGVEFKGLSLGYSSFPADGRAISDLLYLADLNMYQKKKMKHRHLRH